ncbi:hypothetical protein MKS88_005140 [Plasmodium brasilianum]|uniref:Uncharacterized protein n=2 Tax=Plasmodium (Plasmodium) TaxID=418103 RepID=A0A1A8X7N4_PLAMA|nr:conserved Plasmodium protein, unknown function [Plasmodium malariae]KAI4835922.1 hypothetical protein MKS88_005140 [Plasmodium brasilianum]SBS99789.1 conserved Plasmodium protein, unknown function [Plasmodium malariae]SCP02858.1 conserved Plasmodium protein, unknown function [Plasmodium malariae]
MTDSVNPFQAAQSFENFAEPENYTLLKRAKILTSTFFFDGNSWTALEKPLNLKKTIFEDDRILTLKPVEEKFIPAELEASLSGKYNIKVYKNNEVTLCIEGGQKILIKLPITSSIITWNSYQRLPVLPKAWRPTVFILNHSNIFVRVIPEKCLVISKVNNKTDSFKINSIDFSEGFCCCHPINNLALLYGAYEQNQELNTMKLPKLPLTNGKYNYFIHFFSWGTMIVPKKLEIFKGPLCSFKKNIIALIIIPPKVHIYIELRSSSPVASSIDYKKDFLITARKPYITDLEIYLIIQDQLIMYDYSYDLRLNKEKAPISNLNIPLKFKISKEEKEKKKQNPSHECKWSFVNSNEQKCISDSCNSSADHLMSPDLACVFDAETGIYYSTEYGINYCKAFKKLQV